MTSPDPLRPAPAPAAGPAAHVVIEELAAGYEGTRVLDVPELTIRRGEFLSILGPSGCGKTTLLNALAGFVRPSRGRISVDGADVTDVPPHRRGLGLVFQNYALFPHLTVAGNVAYGLKVRRVERAERRERVAEALRLVGLEGYADRRPRQLSGGQQQRVAVARALATRPAVLLLDEPLSNLDAKLRREMRVELRELQQRLGITMVFVTHDQEEALSLSDRIAVLNGGRVEQLDTPERVYRAPASRFVAEFVGAANILDGVADGGGVLRIGDTVLRTGLPGPERGRPAVLALRPERVRLHTAAAEPASADAGSGGAASGVLGYRAFVGDAWHSEVHLAGGATLSARTHAEPPPLGSEVTARWSAEDVIDLTTAPAEEAR
ncbi:ABC transporter ATP-binding protein [Marinitenerispora sediminis]|uniref:ABC-type quaternary amine transporter n=1 Tax=Marinitenerispora sediminis TaxID=1931232 RepID=A0A368T5U7_9ACTN|nr:ABC transporter ATP-binding protein [Marinitenerispora sediminis]RCV54537.1 ABC transporter ATP-binding protein [Marinitenerispora sediminis]RCV58780.1 ABC transporter ATP-binding protein [Marinitenerispora sediminis]